MNKNFMMLLIAVSAALIGGVAFFCYRKKESFNGGDGDDDKAGSKPKFTFWKLDSCPHCVKFIEDFEKLKSKWNGKVDFVTNGDTKEANKNGIHSFPTLTFEMPSGDKETYSGKRGVDQISSWMEGIMQ